jgi:hypothetical protein
VFKVPYNFGFDSCMADGRGVLAMLVGKSQNQMTAEATNPCYVRTYGMFDGAVGCIIFIAPGLIAESFAP